MTCSFFALDESDNPETKIISMTGVVVPVSDYKEVARAIYSFVHEITPNGIGGTPELHGCALLKGHDWATDEIRLRCFEMVANLINQLELRVIRTGYYRSSVKLFTKNDPKLHQLNFMNMSLSVRDELEKGAVIPVIDGLDEKVGRTLARQGQQPALMVAKGWKELCSIQPAENMCEPMFAPSSNSVLIQLVDMVGYMLQAQDYELIGRETSDFKKEVIQRSKIMVSSLVDNEVIRMKGPSEHS
ncbi:DUF3800 domain-containing protein [Agaribacterium haliotis]|uniref:DUF3800 domain-containing protein n=1 Tax=Agaribacterium haliotis TaxID=2013869 RepID=UPI000BB584DC|nr:DUF3800 domain-containing protein [Agaribacterium haliotis]